MAALGRASAPRPAAPAPFTRSRPDPDRVAAVLGRASAAEPRLLLEPDARELISLYGVPLPAWRVTTTPSQTAAAARELGGPVALKAVSSEIVHKSDAGLVLLDIDGADAAARAHEELVERAQRVARDPIRVLITPMIRGGIETVVGAFRDVQFGPVVMVGLGGVLVEALDDVVFRLAPVDPGEARAMFGELRARRLWDGVRGRAPADLAALCDVVVAVSVLVAERPEIAELDLNPVFALSTGAAVVDARVVLA
jgi:acyl-CoA synthetase (NDP forming)